MAVQTDAYLKGRFITGAKPTETDFSDLIDSKRSVNDDLAISDVTGLQTALDNAGGGSVAWGDVTGTLSNQTDLNTALSGKSDTNHTHTAATTSAAGFMSSADKTKLNALNTTLQVPSGGTAGQFVRKGASAPEWADVIQVPTGGTDGQVLSKVSGSVAWADAGGGGVWEELASGTINSNTLTTFTSLDGSQYAYRFICLSTDGDSYSFSNFTVNNANHTAYDVYIASSTPTFNTYSATKDFYGSTAMHDITIHRRRVGSFIIQENFNVGVGAYWRNWADSTETNLTSLAVQPNRTITYKLYRMAFL